MPLLAGTIRLRTTRAAGALLTGLAFASACAPLPGARTGADQDWRVTGGEPGNSRYSPLDQIHRGNVQQLEVAWVYHTGDGPRGQIQATPVVVDGILYSTSSSLKLFALRADTGEELWKFDPVQDGAMPSGVNRGVVYWENGAERRIFYTVGRRLYALDPGTGTPIRSFGQGGWADLAAGLGRESSSQLVATSPGVIYGDLLIQGSRVSEGDGALPGFIRAYDVRTGALRWVFHTIPQPGEFGYETWPPDAYRRMGGANSWAGMAVDTRRGIVFIPTGSASPDFWGGGRIGANLFANTLLALDAATGRRIWHYQTVHHDIWDRDLPAAPNLITVRRGGRTIDAVAQITKSGFVFVFDRETGEPLFPIEERPVPTNALAGEQPWPTQPFPTLPAPFARQTFTEADITDLSPEAHAAVLARFRTLRQPAVLYAPLSREGSIVFPGFDGGGEWGGAAADARHGVLYVNGSDVPWIGTLVPTPAPTSAAPRKGAEVYAASCASCHGPERRGDGDRNPSLLGVGSRLSAAQIRQVIDQGRGFMPSFRTLPEAEKSAVVAHLLEQQEPPAPAAARAGQPAGGGEVSPYQLRSYERWRDPAGYPAAKPPWGTLNAIDLNTGEYLWKIPLGEHAALRERGMPTTGTEQYGGPIVTAGGLLFIAATMDEKIRALDKRTGEILWEGQLPAAGYATPATYSVNGRQYVVVAAGGGKLGTKSSDSYVAFALPRR
ncbi:MAG: PQQ-binding-like beta-propeller repeat protein [Gemmatimonadetes bacterium]|nr:PQQ-binding-like beta-propeller repeat protein [Gemmatimonadota bacterium]